MEIKSRPVREAVTKVYSATLAWNHLKAKHQTDRVGTIVRGTAVQILFTVKARTSAGDPGSHASHMDNLWVGHHTSTPQNAYTGAHQITIKQAGKFAMTQQENEPRQLEGKVALVTGGGNGIGAGICRVLAERGARVAVSDVSLERAQNITAEITDAGGTSIPIAIDVTDVASIDAGVSRVIDEFGQLDICVPNAGVVGSAGFATRSDFNDADWDATNAVNLRGMVNTAEAVLPHMRDRKYGKIVNIASQGGRAPRGADVILGRQIIPYLVSKAGTIQWTHVLAQDVGKHSINVNCICPGTVWTDIWEAIGENRSMFESELGETSKEVFDAAAQTRHPLKVDQTPEDIGYAVAYFASDQASEITGQALNVNAGSVLS